MALLGVARLTSRRCIRRSHLDSQAFGSMQVLSFSTRVLLPAPTAAGACCRSPQNPKHDQPAQLLRRYFNVCATQTLYPYSSHFLLVPRVTGSKAGERRRAAVPPRITITTTRSVSSTSDESNNKNRIKKNTRQGKRKKTNPTTATNRLRLPSHVREVIKPTIGSSHQRQQGIGPKGMQNQPFLVENHAKPIRKNEDETLPEAPITFPTGPPPSLRQGWEWQSKFNFHMVVLEQKVLEAKYGINGNVEDKELEEHVNRFERDLRAIRMGRMTWEEEKRVIGRLIDTKTTRKGKRGKKKMKPLISNKKDQLLLKQIFKEDNQVAFRQVMNGQNCDLITAIKHSSKTGAPGLDFQTRRLIKRTRTIYCSTISDTQNLERRETALKLNFLTEPERDAWLERRNRLFFSAKNGNVIIGSGASMLPTLPEKRARYSGTPILHNAVRSDEQSHSAGEHLKMDSETLPFKRYSIVSFVGIDQNGLATNMCKRVDGLPGDVVRDIHGTKYIVPEGHFWAVGDNEKASYDSRYFGAVPITNARFAMDPPGRQRRGVIAWSIIKDLVPRIVLGSVALFTIVAWRLVRLTLWLLVRAAALSVALVLTTAEMLWYLVRVLVDKLRHR